MCLRTAWKKTLRHVKKKSQCKNCGTDRAQLQKCGAGHVQRVAHIKKPSDWVGPSSRCYAAEQIAKYFFFKKRKNLLLAVHLLKQEKVKNVKAWPSWSPGNKWRDAFCPVVKQQKWPVSAGDLVIPLRENLSSPEKGDLLQCQGDSVESEWLTQSGHPLCQPEEKKPAVLCSAINAGIWSPEHQKKNFQWVQSYLGAKHRLEVNVETRHRVFAFVVSL